jgi:ABC-type transport system involved in cytochrome c biogenesis permease subunit
MCLRVAPLKAPESIGLDDSKTLINMASFPFRTFLIVLITVWDEAWSGGLNPPDSPL